MAMCMEIFILTLLGVFMGQGLDSLLEIEQKWATFVFAVLGLVFGFYRAVKAYERADSKKF